jgi:hypothetical protein
VLLVSRTDCWVDIHVSTCADACTLVQIVHVTWYSASDKKLALRFTHSYQGFFFIHIIYSGIQNVAMNCVDPSKVYRYYTYQLI